MNIYENIVKTLAELDDTELTDDNLHKIKKDISKIYNVQDLPTNIQLQKEYNNLVESWEIIENKKLKFLLMKRKIRSLSWIVPIQVLTKPWPCPWQCIFCPNEAIMPKSYISSEPWAMRALLNQFDPIKQTYNRLLSLQNTWHNTDKIEMIVLWGTFDAYTYDYKVDFIKKLYDACNTFESVKEKFKDSSYRPKSARFTMDLDKLDISLSKSLEEAQKINETSANRIIWLTIETRPDMVIDKNVQFWRELWVTRIEMWVESIFDDVLKANKRWHKLEDVRKAIHTMRKYWLKFSVHIMSWLYKSNLQKDIENFKILFEDPYLQPDELKFYPTSVIPNTELYELYKTWEYKALKEQDIKTIIKEVKENYIPPYTRIKRLIRDIPSDEIVAWSSITNLRQIVVDNLKKEIKKDIQLQAKYHERLYKNPIIKNVDDFENIQISNFDFDTMIFKHKDTKLLYNKDMICLCTRCREIRNQKTPWDTMLVIRKYKSSVWDEYFISFEDNSWYLIGFVRLLLPLKDYVDYPGLWKKTAIIRELHVYWLQEKIWRKWVIAQHRGFWTKLMKMWEYISKQNWFNKLSVISWVWVRWFYKKIWYHLEWTYMVKDI